MSHGQVDSPTADPHTRIDARPKNGEGNDPSALQAVEEARMPPLNPLLSRLAWLPIPILLAAIVAARAAGLRGSYELTTLRLILSSAFYTLVSLGTLYLIGRSFLALGSPGLLLLECGVILWSLAGTVGDAVFHGDANINVSIFNVGIALAGACHLTGAILSLRPQRALHARRLWLGGACALALGALGLVTWAALTHRLPVFFIQGQGGTPVRYWVLISAIAMFVPSAGLLYAGPRAKRPAFTSWYALALLLLAVGLFGIMIQLSLGSVVNWLARTAQWLGGLYLLLAALAALRQSALPLLPPADRSHLGRYPEAIAVVAVLIATAVRLAFLQAMEMRATFITFYPAVMVAALYGGWRAGLLATLLSSIVADYFWIEPAGSFAIGQPADWLGLAIFLASGAMISWITEAMQRAQKRAEEALRVSGEEFRSLAEAMPQIVWATRPDGWNIYFNQQWVDYTGMTMEESYGHGWNTPFHPDDKQRAWESWQRATQHNERYSLECRLRRADGVYRWWLIRGVPMLGANGQILKWFGTCTDIEEIKRSEAALHEANDLLEHRVAERTAALRESEQRFRLALRNAPVSVAIQDRNFVYKWAYNQRSRRPEEILGKTDADLFAPEDIPGILEAKRRVLESGTEVHVQHWLTSNGQRMFLDLYYEPLRDAAGQITGIGIAVVDLTEQKRAEEALKESEERLRLALEAADFGTWDLDLVTGKAVRSLRHDQIFGYQELQPEWTLEMALRHVLPEDRQKIQDAHTPAEAKPRMYVEARMRRLDGSIGWVMSAGRFHCDSEGHPVRIIGVCADITERKKAEEVLSRSQKTLSELIERSPFGTYIVDSRFRIAHMNASSQAGAFVNVRPVIGRDFAEAMRILWPEDVAAGIIAAFRHTLDTGEPYYSPRFLNPRRDVEIVEAYEWELHRMMMTDGQYGVICYYYDSTKLRVAEQALRQSEEQFRTLAETITNLAWWANADGYITWYNRRWYEYTGTTPQQMEGWGWQSVHDPEALPAVMERWKASIATGEPFEMTFPLRGADGKFRQFLTRIQPVKDAQGRVVRWFGTNTDVEALKRAEEELRAARDRFYTAFSSMTFAALLVGADDRIDFANQAFCAMFHLNESPASLKTLTSSEMLEKIRPAYLNPEADLAHIREIVERGRLVQDEEVIMQGGRIFLRDYIPVPSANGKHGRLWIHKDITERKRAEEALRLTQASVDGAAEMVAWFTPDGKVYYVNDATCRTLGYSREELLNMTALDFSPGFTQEQYDEHWREVRKRKSFTLQPMHRRKDGSTYTAEVLVNYVVFGGQEFLFAYGRDITERKRAEAANQASLREKEVMLKEIHHRVKNNLQVIASLVDLQAGGMKDPGLLEMFADVRDRVRSMALVHEKLYQSESLARVDFADYMDSLLSYLSRAHGKTGNAIKLKSDLQPVALSVEKAVPCGLIVNELVSNAYKHAFRGRAEGEITAALGMGADGRVWLRVRDDGVGLPSGLDWRQSQSLGLRLIQLLAGQLHASVEVRNSGSGTEFEIAFELEKPREQG